MNVSVTIAASFGALGMTVGSSVGRIVGRVLSRPSPSGGAIVTQRPASGWWSRYRMAGPWTGLVFALLTAQMGLSAYLPAYLYLAALAVAVALIEIGERELPDVVVLLSYLVGVLVLMPAGAVGGNLNGAVRATAGLAILGLLYLALALVYRPLIRIEAAKVAGLLGFHLGWLSWGTLLVGTAAAIIAAAACVGVTRSGRRVAASNLPAATLMVLAVAPAVFLTGPITHWYASLYHLA